MKAVALLAVLILLAAAPAVADDLLEVTLRHAADAVVLQGTGATVATVDRNVYLVVADPSVRQILDEHTLVYREILAGIDRTPLAVDRRPVPSTRADRTLVYERGGLRIVAAATEQALSLDSDLLPLGLHPIVVRYLPPRESLAVAADLPIELDTLIDLVSEDSLRAYTLRLEAFHRRLTGTDSCNAARDWIAAKFRSFGYDSVVIDPFIGRQLWDRHPVQSYNVVACKPGTVNPDRQIIIGGHFDAVPDCPGADDNATGTAGTLEIARVLAAANLPVTLIFIAFDSEESWLWGSTHYADSVAAEGADIILMINLDMIAHYTNNSRANVYYGPEHAYAELWAQLAPAYAFTGVDLAISVASDHQPFLDNGYDAIFVQEDYFSNRYHQPTDSSTYLNFEYMTRMVKASLHTALATADVPPPVRITAVLEPGDGHSQFLMWRRLDFNGLDYLRVAWYPAANPSAKQSAVIPASDTSYTVTGLIEDVPYVFYVQAFDTQLRTSYAIKEAHGTPRSTPLPPEDLVTRPIFHGVRLWWGHNNLEMDLAHYSVIRDGALIATVTDTTYDDFDPSLGTDLHRYYVQATDTDLNCSDTSTLLPSVSRAAMLEPEKVLAVNRSSSAANGIWVNEVETGLLLRDALATFDCDYRSDTAATSHPGEGISLLDMVSHGVMIVGDESGRGMDISKPPAEGGILDDLAYYCSIGGKLVVFGRFGTITRGDTVDYTGDVAYDDTFEDIFHIARRIQTATLLLPSPNRLIGDFVGAEPLAPGYPALVWDSTLTAAHSAPLLALSGISMTSYVELNSPDAQPLYGYRSASDTSAHNGGTVAWSYFGSDYRYIFFDIPLSFCERTAAIETLRKAVNDLMNEPTDSDSDPIPLPGRFTLGQNYPNPFNATTTISYTLPQAAPVKLVIYNLLGQTVTSWRAERQSAGTHTVTWNGTNQSGRSVATGIYLYRLESGDRIATKKMLLLK